MKSSPQILPIMLIIIGLLMVIAPASMLIFWISMGGLEGLFTEFNPISVVGDILIIIVGVFLIRRGLLARRTRR